MGYGPRCSSSIYTEDGRDIGSLVTTVDTLDFVVAVTAVLNVGNGVLRGNEAVTGLIPIAESTVGVPTEIRNGSLVTVAMVGSDGMAGGLAAEDMGDGDGFGVGSGVGYGVGNEVGITLFITTSSFVDVVDTESMVELVAGFVSGEEPDKGVFVVITLEASTFVVVLDISDKARVLVIGLIINGSLVTSIVVLVGWTSCFNVPVVIGGLELLGERDVVLSLLSSSSSSSGRGR